MGLDVGGSGTWLKSDEQTGDATMHIQSGVETKAAVGNFTTGCVRECGQRYDANRLSSTIERRLTIRLKANGRYYLETAQEDCR